MAKDTSRRYTGKLKVNGGPVPIKTWKDRDRTSSKAHGNDLRGERKPSVNVSHPT